MGRAGLGWGGMPGRGVFSDRSVRTVLGTARNKLNKYFMKTPSFSCDCAHSILHTVSICTIAHANWPRILAKHQLWPQCPAMGQHCTEHIKHYIAMHRYISWEPGLVVSDHDSTVLISSFLNWKYERDFIKRANYSVLRFSDPIHSNPLTWINKKKIFYNTSIYFDRTQRIFSSPQNIVPCTKCFAQFLRHGLAQAALMQKIQLNSSSSYWLPFLAAQRSSDNKMR